MNENFSGELFVLLQNNEELALKCNNNNSNKDTLILHVRTNFSCCFFSCAKSNDDSAQKESIDFLHSSTDGKLNCNRNAG
jgi:hypothetical protein